MRTRRSVRIGGPTVFWRCGEVSAPYRAAEPKANALLYYTHVRKIGFLPRLCASYSTDAEGIENVAHVRELNNAKPTVPQIMAPEIHNEMVTKRFGAMACGNLR